MKYFNLLKHNNSEIEDAIKQLREKSVVNITKFFEVDFINSLIKDTLCVYNKKLQRKDFLMKQTENTPRNMFSVPEKAIDEVSKIIPEFYNDSSVKQFLSTLAQEEVKTLPWAGERYVINGLSNSSDTHGWHWDDYSYALVFIAKSPSPDQGGAVECIRNTNWDRKNPRVHEIVNSNKSEIYHYDDGSFYLMKSDTTLHRVTPIVWSAVRIAIAMSWCSEADLLKDIDHETVYELYGI
ncbi:MAG: hypothetical protein KIT27_00450 [Legionellales bacterium]|nr:hypothetical protein [Legionellales bacterium]